MCVLDRESDVFTHAVSCVTLTALYLLVSSTANCVSHSHNIGIESWEVDHYHLSVSMEAHTLYRLSPTFQCVAEGNEAGSLSCSFNLNR